MAVFSKIIFPVLTVVGLVVGNVPAEDLTARDLAHRNLAGLSLASPAIVKTGATYIDPTHGFSVTLFKGTNTIKEVAKFTKDNNFNAPFTVVNPTEGIMCLLASYADLTMTPLKPVYISYNSSVEFGRLPVPANTSALINFLPRGAGVAVNGRAQVHFDCNEDCTKCPGDDHARHTLVEYRYGDSATVPNGIDELWTNLSNVDGITSNVNITVFGPDAKVCHKSRGCNVSAATLKQVCPVGRHWEESSIVQGCKSDCHATGSHEHCCTGDFADRNVRACPKSSTFLKQLCPDAYAYPYDDQFSMDTCYSPSGVRLEFSPFSKKN
ncbi:hypothetical protein VTL71DRAFT_9304 [Oculimacula yallundae]|uniref:Osmotin, thaumatin-like protein n=1 Tax=Oculimacula yallundae TaxID=86028 RepID=A0ABR4BSS2_9HELO